MLNGERIKITRIFPCYGEYEGCKLIVTRDPKSHNGEVNSLISQHDLSAWWRNRAADELNMEEAADRYEGQHEPVETGDFYLKRDEHGALRVASHAHEDSSPHGSGLSRFEGIDKKLNEPGGTARREYLKATAELRDYVNQTGWSLFAAFVHSPRYASHKQAYFQIAGVRVLGAFTRLWWAGIVHRISPVTASGIAAEAMRSLRLCEAGLA